MNDTPPPPPSNPIQSNPNRPDGETLLTMQWHICQFGHSATKLYCTYPPTAAAVAVAAAAAVIVGQDEADTGSARTTTRRE